MKHIRLDKDSAGVKYKYLDRTCTKCKRFPCFEGIEVCKCDFAKYGCRLYLE